MKKILIINGPNLNLLGKREPGVYGNLSFEEYFDRIQNDFKEEVELTYFQSNYEGALIDEIHRVGFELDGIVLNAGAYTHTSIAIADAIKAIPTPVVEVHISNTTQRETYRHHSYLSPVVKGVILGFGLNSYKLAVQSFLYE